MSYGAEQVWISGLLSNATNEDGFHGDVSPSLFMKMKSHEAARMMERGLCARITMQSIQTGFMALWREKGAQELKADASRLLCICPRGVARWGAGRCCCLRVVLN